MRVRRLLTGLAAGLALTLAGLAGAPIAQADSAAPAAPACTHPCHSPGAGWSYVTDYYWASACADTGNQLVNSGKWSAYQCTGGGNFENYELWVR